jgi:hypothetical protein
MVGGFQEVSEVERLFQQLRNIPQHSTYPQICVYQYKAKGAED